MWSLDLKENFKKELKSNWSNWFNVKYNLTRHIKNVVECLNQTCFQVHWKAFKVLTQETCKLLKHEKWSNVIQSLKVGFEKVNQVKLKWFTQCWESLNKINEITLIFE